MDYLGKYNEWNENISLADPAAAVKFFCPIFNLDRGEYVFFRYTSIDIPIVLKSVHIFASSQRWISTHADYRLRNQIQIFENSIIRSWIKKSIVEKRKFFFSKNINNDFYCLYVGNQVEFILILSSFSSWIDSVQAAYICSRLEWSLLNRVKAVRIEFESKIWRRFKFINKDDKTPILHCNYSLLDNT